jgi:hypothetical protein
MFFKNLTRITGTLDEDQYTRPVILRMRNVSVKIVQKKHILCSITFFENRAVCEIKCKKNCSARQAIVDSMAHVHCMLDT